MKNTNYFIELIIAGLGSAIWIMVLIQTINEDSIKHYLEILTHEDSSPVLIIALITPLIYILGILVDRMLDEWFDKIVEWANPAKNDKSSNDSDKTASSSESRIISLLKKVFAGPELGMIEGEDGHREAKNYIYLYSETLTDAYEYRRMKIRVCRTWAFNGFMLFAACFFKCIMEKDFGYSITLITLLLALVSSFFAYHAWKILLKKEDKFLAISKDLIEDKINNDIHKKVGQTSRPNKTSMQ